MSYSVQQGLQKVSANTILAGPTSGAANFRRTALWWRRIYLSVQSAESMLRLLATRPFPVTMEN